MEGTPACGAARFSCPPNFTAVAPDPDPPGFSLEVLTGPDAELWLIRAPADFAPQCLNGRSVPLSGSKTVKGKLDGQRHRYRLLSSGPQAGDATLLVSSAEAGGKLACAPAPGGSLQIMEGPQDYFISRAPLQPIPTSLPPQIPAGLRPRFCAFGGSLPVTGPGSATSGKRKKKRKVAEASAIQDMANGNRAMEVDTAWGGLEMGVRKRKKKKHQVGEGEMMEPVAEMAEPLGLPFPSPTSSKKRKRKSKGAETVQPEEEPGHSEPPDGSILSPAKRRRQEEAEGMEAVDGTVEPQEEAIPLSPTKKRRKEKRQNLVVEPKMGLPGEMAVESELSEHGLLAEVAPVLPKKTKKKREEKWLDQAPALGAEGTEAALPANLELQEAPAPSKKKKERGQKATEPGSEVTDPGEPKTAAVQGSTKKKKKKRDQETGVQDSIPHSEMTPTGQEKKHKRRLQQEPE